MIFAKEHALAHPDIDFYVVGHRHTAVDRQIAGSHARLIILGDCFAQFNYAIFDGTTLKLEQFDSTKA
jgi:UDP-2,3-diacylglucosamine hydrolase